MSSTPQRSDVGTPGHVWQFADCEYDERRHELRVRGTVVDLELKPLSILHQLLLHAGEVVTKDELLDEVWTGTAVVEGSLTTAISKLRKALGSDESIIVTVPRIGYRLGVPVRSRPIAAPPWQDLNLEPGEAVPGRAQWRLVRRLDLSPSSEVWLAEHPKTHEARVFKFAADPQRLRGLKREVTLARLLRESLGDRSAFVRVFEWNFDNPPYFIESEYCGPHLAEWAESQGGLAAMPLGFRLRLLIDVASAVAAAHSLDVLHKDLKPGNILVSAGAAGAAHIKVADFGSASLLAPSRLGTLNITNIGFTQPGDDSSLLRGTVMYAAPELLIGQSPSPASDVYALGVLLYQIVVGDFRKPMAAGWEAEIADPLLRDDIAQAAAGDPARRLQSAAELAERLETLDRRRREAEAATQAREHERLAQQKRAAARARRPWFALTAVLGVVALAGTWMFYQRSTQRAAPLKILAVLPFQNVGTDPELDFLRLALADEVATSLSQSRGIAVRPFAATSKFTSADVDLEQIGRDLSADGVVTGRFVKVGEQLHITLEATERAARQSVWRDTVDIPARSLIAAQIQIGLRVRSGLAPAFGGSPGEATGQPQHEEAYELFLRSVSLAFEAEPNPQGIAMLERAVELDPAYAPAWVSLARRYYVEARYGGGTPGSMNKYEAAMERAVALDPSYVSAAAGLIVSRVERGDLVGAHTRAADLVQRRPDSVDAQFALSYVLRFAGLLDEAGEHCEAALLLDPRTVTSGLRSCAIVFLLAGDYARAMSYLQVSPGSSWAKAFSLDILVRQGKVEEARQVGEPKIPQYSSYEMLLACAEEKPAADILALASTVKPSDDPESNYLASAHLAYCSQTDAALDLLRRAITGNYCSTAAFESDRLFDRLRTLPAFTDLKSAATGCRQAFLDMKDVR